MTTACQSLCITHCSPAQAGSAPLGEVKVEGGARAEPLDFRCSPQCLAQLIEVIQYFCHKYLESFSQATVHHVLRKIWGMEEGALRTKGTRELVAAVVYCQYSGVIRLKLKDFSAMNQLHQKTFNKKYVAYQTLLKRQAAATTPTAPTAEEQKLEDCAEKEEESAEKPQGEGREGREVRPVATPKQAIELIYDGIFKSQYFQSHRRELIEKMAERCSEIDPKIYAEMGWTENSSLKLFYAIFEHLKGLGMNIGFTKFREAVTAFAGLHLKRTFAHATEKIFKTVNRISEGERDANSASGSESSTEPLL